MKRAYLLMHLAILLWGFTGILGKAIDMSEGMIVWYRMLISAVGLIPILITKKIKIPPVKEAGKIILTGALVCVHWIFFYASIKASNVSIALSCFSSISLFTAILDPLSKGKKPKLSEVFLGIVIIVGLFIIFSAQQIYLTGIILALISAMLGAIFTILNKSLTDHHEAEVITFYELASGFLLFTLLLPLYLNFTSTTFEIPDLTNWVYLLVLGFICTSFAFTISLKALKKLDAFTLNLSVNLEPIYSIILAIILFKEHEMLNTGFYIGTVIILASIAVHSWYDWKFHRGHEEIRQPLP
jgi:drug/metabolite transporter (DMT)-like permease